MCYFLKASQHYKANAVVSVDFFILNKWFRFIPKMGLKFEYIKREFCYSYI